MFYNMTVETLFASIDHLYKAINLIVGVNNKIVDNDIVDAGVLITGLSDGWLEINTCRVYTEHIVDMEELLIPSMGLVNDAKCMLESLIKWNLGLTMYGKYNIVKCLRLAALDHINPAIEELEYWFDHEKNNNDFIKCVTF